MSKGSWVYYGEQQLYSVRSGRYSYLFRQEYMDKAKYIIEDNQLNHYWIIQFCDLWFDHRTNQQFKGGKYADNESE